VPDLTIRNLECRYGDLVIVDKINIDIKDGEFVSLLGPSGCGKTTTLRLIAGFLTPTAGTIASDGAVLSSAHAVVPTEHRGIGMIFQSYAVWPHMTVADNVAFGLRVRRQSQSEIKRRVAAMLKTVKLDHLAERYPAALSGGQQQRVALARALVVEPKILLLDEPLSNLDVHLREELRQEIRRLHDAFGMTTIYVTHDQSEAMATSDRVVVMNGGRVEQIDAPYELYLHPRTRFVAEFIGKTNVVTGTVQDGIVMGTGFSFPAAADDLPLTTRTYSVRPELVRVASAGEDSTPSVNLKAVVTERTYLGDRWEYGVVCEPGGLKLKMSTLPAVLLQPEDKISIAISCDAFSQIKG
jgi:ABC-type Fe3+/spermidine/putrescine transport system ATPase subunit